LMVAGLRATSVLGSAGDPADRMARELWRWRARSGWPGTHSVCARTGILGSEHDRGDHRVHRELRIELAARCSMNGEPLSPVTGQCHTDTS